MRGNIVPFDSRATIVCVDTYENNVPTGQFFDPYLNEWDEFKSVTQFLLGMEAVLDENKAPQSYTAMRQFRTAGMIGRHIIEAQAQTGKLATFSVRILFRQNASWQGTVTWVEGDEEFRFRSVKELIYFADGILQNVTSKREMSGV